MLPFTKGLADSWGNNRERSEITDMWLQPWACSWWVWGLPGNRRCRGLFSPDTLCPCKNLSRWDPCQLLEARPGAAGVTQWGWVHAGPQTSANLFPPLCRSTGEPSESCSPLASLWLGTSRILFSGSLFDMIWLINNLTPYPLLCPLWMGSYDFCVVASSANEVSDTQVCCWNASASWMEVFPCMWVT